MTDSPDRPHVFPTGRKRGELLFCALFILFSAALLSQITRQTTWLDGKGLTAQPRFWPAISISGMLLFSGLLWDRRRKVERTPGRWREAAVWAGSLEYVGYYVAYVLAISLIGYLLATVLFCVLLTARVGLRTPAALGAALLFAVAVVLVFKAAFGVKIPGGLIYDYAPASIRYLLIRYL
jgi:hypothetical protein